MVYQLRFFARTWLSFLGVNQEKGQGLVEYALILLLIVLAVMAGLWLFREGLINIYHDISNEIGTANP